MAEIDERSRAYWNSLAESARQPQPVQTAALTSATRQDPARKDDEDQPAVLRVGRGA
jgi:hypothetical protein